MKLQKVALSLFLVIAVYLLHIGQALLQPIVIAGVIAYLISILAHAISALSVGGVRCLLLSMLLAVGVILASLSLLIQLITENIKSVVTVAPAYQANLEARIFEAYQWFGEEEEAPNLKEF